MSLLDRHLVFVTGKGGVGKTTVAASLAIGAAARGACVRVVEVGGQTGIPPLLQRDASGASLLRAGRVAAVSIEADRAVSEFLANAALPSPVVRRLADRDGLRTAVLSLPGARDLATLAAIRAAVEDPATDLVVVDGPATGHALAMLSAPQRGMSIVRGGPVHAEARQLHDLLTDALRTGVLLVARGEELSTTESIEADERLATLEIATSGVLVNARLLDALPGEDVASLEALACSGTHAGAAIAACRWQHRAAASEHSEVERLRSAVGCPVAESPVLDAVGPEGPTLEPITASIDAQLLGRSS